jgi:hypothetical protein
MGTDRKPGRFSVLIVLVFALEGFPLLFSRIKGLWGRVDSVGAATDAAMQLAQTHEPLLYLVPAQTVRLSGSKTPTSNLKRDRRFKLLANVLVSVRAILPTGLMVAGGKGGTDLNAGQSGEGATATGDTPMLFQQRHQIE